MPKDHSLTKAQKEKILKTFNSLDRFEDKVWYYLHLTSRNFIIATDYYSVDERASLEASNNSKNEEEAIKVREALGLPGQVGVSEGDEKFVEEIGDMLRKEIYADGTPETKKEVYTKLAVVEMKIFMMLANEVEEMKKIFPEDDPYREFKATYIVNRALSETGMLDQGLNEFYVSLNMPNLETGKPLILEEEESIDFKNINKGLVDRLSPEEKAKYDLGKSARSEIKIPTVKVPGQPIPVRDPAVLKWLDEAGNIMIQNRAKEVLVEGYQKFRKEILDYKPSLFNNTNTLDSFYSKEINDTNLMLIRAAKNQLTDTIDKKSGKNAPLFEKIVKDVTSLDSLISGGEYTKAHLLKEELGKECLKYMVGKEKVRRNDFGRDRVDAILAIMAEVLPESQFRKEIARINSIRGVGPKHENYINADDYKHHTITTPEGDFSTGKIYQKWTDKGLAKEKEKLDATENNRMFIPNRFKANLAAIEGLYGREFDKTNKTLMAAFDGIGGNSKLRTFKPINEKFKAVAKYGAGERTLSEKDFVAIAFAGALTPEAAAKDPRFANAKPEDKAFYTGPKYTSGIGAINIDSDIKKYADIIQFGRTSASDALKEYEKGNKTPLAHILSSGIKNLCNKAKNSEVLYYDAVNDAEMAVRMMEMMYRDTDLFNLAQKEGFSNEDIKSVKSMRLASHATAVAIESTDRLVEAEVHKKKLTKDEKIRAVTDIVFKRIIDESYMMNNSRMLRNPDYQKEYAEIKAKYDREIKPINDELAKNMVGKEYIARRAELFDKKQQLEEYLEYNKGVLRAKYLPENQLMKGLTNKESFMKMRQDVKKVVEKSGLYKCSTKDLKKKIEDKKFVQNMKAVVDSYQNQKPAPSAAEAQKQKKQEIQKTSKGPHVG